MQTPGALANEDIFDVAIVVDQERRDRHAAMREQEVIGFSCRMGRVARESAFER